jgi:membrane protein YdbS with pleckstrin-like domain
MICPACGGSVPDGAAFCPHCGAKTSVARGQAAPPAAASLMAAAGDPEGKADRPLPGSGRDDPEEEVWSGNYSPKAMYGLWIAAAVATIVGLIAVGLWQNNTLGWSIFGVAVLLVWGGLLLSLAYRRMAVRYRLTTQRLFHEKGILRRVTDRIETIDIDDVTYEQGLVERMVGVGTIHVSSSDRTTPELVMPGIDQVQDVADKIDRARRAERARRGLYIESV